MTDDAFCIGIPILYTTLGTAQFKRLLREFLGIFLVVVHNSDRRTKTGTLVSTYVG